MEKTGMGVFPPVRWKIGLGVFPPREEGLRVRGGENWDGRFSPSKVEDRAGRFSPERGKCLGRWEWSECVDGAKGRMGWAIFPLTTESGLGLK